MTLDADPYRTLGLASGASADEVKRAYRRLAKTHHPDAAGEQALPRFLAIQAAYEQLIGGLGPGVGRRRASPASRRPWEADPDRTDATRRAYGGRARSASPGGPASSAGSGTPPGPGGGAAGAAGGGAAPGAGAGRGETTGGAGASGRSWSGRAGGAAGAGSGSTRTGRQRRNEPPGTTGDRSADPPPGATDGPPNKATLGSTSYDGADAGPFEPDWGGASWYGTTSGTYWTLNPKEYADPRKHGPEYQARARRATRVGGSATTGPVAPDPAPGPTHTTSSWWESTAGAAAGAGAEASARAAAEPTAAPRDRGARPSSASRAEPTAARPTARPAPGPASGAAPADAPPPDIGRAAADIGRAVTDDRVGGPGGRVARAVIGWLPVAFGVGWLAGELTGCGRFAATCDGTADPFVLLLQVAILAVLLLLPVVASIAATGAVALLVASVGATLILSATGGAADGGSRQSALGAVLLVAWLVGVAIAGVRRARKPRSPARPVS